MSKLREEFQKQQECKFKTIELLFETSNSKYIEWLEQNVNGNGKTTFREAANPMLKYLNDNHHPHVTAVITQTDIQLVEGLKGEYKIFDYVNKD